MDEPFLSQCKNGACDQEVVRHSPTTPRSWPTGEIQAWESRLRGGAAGAVYLHPRLVLADLDQYRASQILTIPVTDSPDGELRGLAVLSPKVVQIRTLPLPFGVMSAKGYRLVGNQVVGPPDEVVVPLVRGAARLLSDKKAEYLLFEDIECDSDLWKAIHLVAGEPRHRIRLFYRHPAQLHHWIRFPERPADYWKKFKSKTRGNLRRMADKFEHRILNYTSPYDVAGFLDSAEAVSRKSWQAARLGVRIHNTHEARKYWGQVAELGGFRSYILEHAGVPAAFVQGTCWNGCFTYEEVAYDQTHFQYSPGTILLYRILEDLIANEQPRLFDFGAGDAEYKRLFSTHQTRSGQILLARRPFPSFYLHMERLSALCVDTLQSMVRSVGILSYLRRCWRRVPVGQSE